MGDIVNKNMKIGEMKRILNNNGIETPYGWQIVLWGLFNTYKTDEAEILGYGRSAEFSFKTDTN